MGTASARRPSDRELISRFLAARDESAFAEIVGRYSRLVMSVALHALRDQHAAEDAFQATFLVLARSARRIRNRDSLASWLHGTTFRVSRRLLRTRLRRKEQDLPTQEIATVELPAPWDPPARPDEQAALDEELARLSEGLRGPLVLHYLEGRTVPEIAAELRMTPACVEGRLKRGKQTLRKRLLKRGVLLSSAVFGAGLTVPAEAQIAAPLVAATVAACLKSTATATLAPIAATTIQQIALEEMAAMTRLAILKTALLCGGVAGVVGLAGAGANGTLGLAWADRGDGEKTSQALAGPEDGNPLDAPKSIDTRVSPVSAVAAPVQINGPGYRVEADGITLNAPVGNGHSPDRVIAEHGLRRPVSVEMTDRNLLQAINLLRDQTGIRIRIDADFDANLNNARFTLLSKGVKLSALLDSILADIPGDQYGYRVEDDGIHIVNVSNPAKNTRKSGVVIPDMGGAGMAGMPGGGFGGMGMAMGMDAGIGGAGMMADGPPRRRADGRPKSVDDALTKVNQRQAEELRDYIEHLEGLVLSTGPAKGGPVTLPDGANKAGGSSPFGTGARLNFRGRDSVPSNTVTGLDDGNPLEFINNLDLNRKSPRANPTGPVRQFRPDNSNEQRIREALETVVDLQFTGQTLQEALQFLSTTHKFTIRLDTTALTAAGVGPDHEIVLMIDGISLRSALNEMFKDLGGVQLDYVIEDEVMKVTTKEKADQTLQTVIYDVSGLGDAERLQVTTILEKTVEPRSWETSGGQGTIVPLDNKVIITTSRRLHDKTAEILDMLLRSATESDGSLR